MFGFKWGAKRAAKKAQAKKCTRWVLTISKRVNTFYGLASGEVIIEKKIFYQEKRPRPFRFAEGGFMVESSREYYEFYRRHYEIKRGEKGWKIDSLVIANLDGNK